MTTPVHMYDDSVSKDGPGPADLPAPDARLQGFGQPPVRETEPVPAQDRDELGKFR